MEILGIDMSRAFDTIRRDRLIQILETFLDDSELRMICLLLADTILEPWLAKGNCATFNTTIGTRPRRQPVTCTIHCIPRSSPTRSKTNATTTPSNRYKLPLDIAYADDVDFVSHSRAFLSQVRSIAPSCLRHWFLFVNESKTERTSMRQIVWQKDGG